MTKTEKVIRITKIVCEYLEIEYSDIFKKTRKSEIVNAKQISHYFALNYSRGSVGKMTLESIGKLIGNMDHASVLHSNKVVLNRKIERKYNETIYNIDQEIRLFFAKNIVFENDILIKSRQKKAVYLQRNNSACKRHNISFVLPTNAMK